MINKEIKLIKCLDFINNEKNDFTTYEKELLEIICIRYDKEDIEKIRNHILNFEIFKEAYNIFWNSFNWNELINDNNEKKFKKFFKIFREEIKELSIKK